MECCRLGSCRPKVPATESPCGMRSGRGLRVVSRRSPRPKVPAGCGAKRDCAVRCWMRAAGAGADATWTGVSGARPASMQINTNSDIVRFEVSGSAGHVVPPCVGKHTESEALLQGPRLLFCLRRREEPNTRQRCRVYCECSPQMACMAWRPDARHLARELLGEWLRGIIQRKVAR